MVEGVTGDKREGKRNRKRKRETHTKKVMYFVHKFTSDSYSVKSIPGKPKSTHSLSIQCVIVAAAVIIVLHYMPFLICCKRSVIKNVSSSFWISFCKNRSMSDCCCPFSATVFLKYTLFHTDEWWWGFPEKSIWKNAKNMSLLWKTTKLKNWKLSYSNWKCKMEVFVPQLLVVPRK